MLEKTLENHLDCKKIKPVKPKDKQPWIFIGRTDAEAEGPLLWPPDAKSQLIGKDPDAGKDRGQKEKRAAEDEMFRYHHWLKGHEFEQTRVDSGGQSSLLCFSPWGCKALTWLSSWKMTTTTISPLMTLNPQIKSNTFFQFYFLRSYVLFFPKTSILFLSSWWVLFFLQDSVLSPLGNIFILLGLNILPLSSDITCVTDFLTFAILLQSLISRLWVIFNWEHVFHS